MTKTESVSGIVISVLGGLLLLLAIFLIARDQHVAGIIIAATGALTFAFVDKLAAQVTKLIG